jgi:hypothetical protein
MADVPAGGRPSALIEIEGMIADIRINQTASLWASEEQHAHAITKS